MKLLKEFLKVNALIFSILFIFNLIQTFVNIEQILINVNNITGILISAILGGILIGNPSVSYVIGYKLLNLGVHPCIVGTFVLAWLTVGFLNIPIEAKYFGIKFSIKKNALFFALAIIFGIICWLIY